MKDFFGSLLFLLALAPWGFVIFVVPGAWFLCDVWIMPTNMQNPLNVFGWGPLFGLWTYVLFALSDAVS